jgi:K+-transporting ATPase ATPase A chain
VDPDNSMTWQAYEGETQASYFADMAGLVVAQFTAAAVGLAVALAVVRGIAGSSRRIGNFWADLTRSLVRVFVPLSVIGALVLVSQGVVENFSGFRSALPVAGGTQLIPGGPVASMEVIKLLDTNIGGNMEGKEARFGCCRCSSPASWSAGPPSSSARRSARRR